MSFCEDENLGNFEWEKNKFISKSVIRDEHVRQFFKAVWVIFVFEKFQLISIFIGYFNIKYFVFKLIKKYNTDQNFMFTDARNTTLNAEGIQKKVINY